MAKKRRKKVQLVRNVVIASIGFAVMGLAGYGIFYGLGESVSGNVQEGTHYRVIDGTRDLRRTVDVVEYFSYACVHCRNLDPMIEDWKDTLPEGSSFRRVHVSYSPELELLARTYIVLESQGALAENHERIFGALHDRGRQFVSLTMLADFVDGFGIDRKTFTDAFNSSRASMTVRKNERAFREASLTGVPSLVIANKYVVSTGIGGIGRKQSLEIARELVEAELANRVP